MTAAAAFSDSLQQHRAAIDRLDDEIIRLVIERTLHVRQVGMLKREHFPGRSAIRPGREAEMVRRVLAKMAATDLPPLGIAALWRTLIGLSTSLEMPQLLSVYAPTDDDHLAWVAREYFSPAFPLSRQPHIKRVIGDVMDGKAGVGIIPALGAGETSYWWSNLLEGGKDTPKIFAVLPFVHQAGQSPIAMAIGRLEPEETGDDTSLIVVECTQDVSQQRLQALLKETSLDARWLTMTSLHAGSRHHLFELRGFYTDSHPTLAAFRQSLGRSLTCLTMLGAYANPIILPSTVIK